VRRLAVPVEVTVAEPLPSPPPEAGGCVGVATVFVAATAKEEKPSGEIPFVWIALAVLVAAALAGGYVVWRRRR